MKMWELTWSEIVDFIENDHGVILPIGSVEQHGPHLPLITDTYLPTRLALDIAEEVKMMVAPPIMYATNSRPLSGGGQTFPGTTSIRAVTFINQVEDIIREFKRSGFKKIILLNWHMENSNFIYEAAYQATKGLSKEDVKVMVIEAPFDKLDDETMDFVFEGCFGGWSVDHAGIAETSLMMYLKPEYVKQDRIIDDCPGMIVDYDVLPIDTDRFVAKSGCLWKATMATPEKGKVLWDTIKAALVKTISNEF
jgi:creatinine amidohydrolase